MVFGITFLYCIEMNQYFSCEQAKKYIPEDLPIVNFFGWTLGGFYLARYSDSPVGAFDELVALAGIIWDPPASCAWAARVYVNNREARNHGLNSVGLPSRLAGFRLVATAHPNRPRNARTQKKFPEKDETKRGNQSLKHTWWGAPLECSIDDSNRDDCAHALQLTNTEKKRHPIGRLIHSTTKRCRSLASPVCTIEMPPEPHGWGPQIQLFLPSFSGATPEHPGLLKYSLRLLTTVRFISPLKLTFPTSRGSEDEDSMEVMDGILKGRPLLCMAFDNMNMMVQSPEIWSPRPLSEAKRSHAM